MQEDKHKIIPQRLISTGSISLDGCARLSGIHPAVIADDCKVGAAIAWKKSME
jgi:hypothetical protein